MIKLDASTDETNSNIKWMYDSKENHHQVLNNYPINSTKDNSIFHEGSLNKVEQVLKIQEGGNTSWLINKNKELFNNEIDEFTKFLGEYYCLLKQNQNILTQVRNQSEAELDLIKMIFDKIRKEIDQKEKLLKAELSTIALNIEKSLVKDIKYLTNKCLFLSHKLEMLKDHNYLNIKTDNWDTICFSDEKSSLKNLNLLQTLLWTEKSELKRTKLLYMHDEDDLLTNLPAIKWNFQKFWTILDEMCTLSNNIEWSKDFRLDNIQENISSTFTTQNSKIS